MQSLLKILLRYSNFLVFIGLEVAAFLLIGLNNAAPRSYLFSTANGFVAWQNEQVSQLREYFALREQNELLSAENAFLRNVISSMDSTKVANVFRYQSAKVIQMTTDRTHNYITISRGSREGIRRGQGVINAEGVVGIVRTVGPNYSIVMPVINTSTQLSCRFTKNDYIGTLHWNGKDIEYAQLADVASHMDVQVGDTIVTSGLSPVFPEGIPVGIVENSILKPGDSYHTINVRLHTHFKRLKHVEVVNNIHQHELEELNNGLE